MAGMKGSHLAEDILLGCGSGTSKPNGQQNLKKLSTFTGHW
jgi:hypothetical protein